MFLKGPQSIFRIGRIKGFGFENREASQRDSA